MALRGGGLLAGFLGPFSQASYQISHLSLLELLIYRCLFHLPFALPLFVCAHSLQLWMSLRCSCLLLATLSSFTKVLPSSALFSLPSVLRARVSVTRSGRPIGQHRGTNDHCGTWTRDTTEGTKGLYMALSYVLAFLGVLALTLGLPTNSGLPVWLDGSGGLCTRPFSCPLLPFDPLSWSCVRAVVILALVSFVCMSWLVTKAHPALVCTILHSEVVVPPPHAAVLGAL